MQTFLAYPVYRSSARCLDKQRLWKQVVESKQMHNTLTGLSQGWKNHPATLMWKGHEESLFQYFQVMLEESINRGIKVKAYTLQKEIIEKEIVPPYWLGNQAFHASHRSNLLRKNPEWYSKFGWQEPNNLPYIWPAQI